MQDKHITAKYRALAPPEIIAALGEFDLDPASPIDRPWSTAKAHYTEIDDGLAQAWHGRVWLCPPYGRQVPVWLERLAVHGNGIALILARTDTRCFQWLVFGRADAVLFLRGRIKFYGPDGSPAESSAAPSCLAAYGKNNVEALRNSWLKGHLVELRTATTKGT